MLTKTISLSYPIKRLLTRTKQQNRLLLLIACMLTILVLVIWLRYQPSLIEVTNLDSEDILLISDLSKHRCTPSYPSILFFNRIPKSASTSLQLFFRYLSKTLDIEIDISPKGAWDWDGERLKAVQDQTLDLLERAKKMNADPDSKHPKGIYSEHFYFTDFPILNEEGIKYTYVTMIRNPVDRAISSFYYYHFTKTYKIPQDMVKVSLRKCFEEQLPGCEGNLITKYFCGLDSRCTSQNGDPDYALKTAKYNLLHSYVAVGLVEDFSMSMKLFQMLLPDFIPPFLEVPDNLEKINANEEDYLTKFNKEDRALVLANNKLDIYLYEFAKKIFYTRLHMCGLASKE